jgi:hypothetical protein
LIRPRNNHHHSSDKTGVEIYCRSPTKAQSNLLALEDVDQIALELGFFNDETLAWKSAERVLIWKSEASQSKTNWSNFASQPEWMDRFRQILIELQYGNVLGRAFRQDRSSGVTAGGHNLDVYSLAFKVGLSQAQNVLTSNYQTLFAHEEACAGRV